ncbi:MAG: tetratricopeptide repeat protein [Gammaproteobacteria bacterium]|nr:tetratricopeptide repeat protein [Gammaproteobacteria bacterium]
MDEHSLKYFNEIVAVSEPELNLAEAALAIATFEYPEMDTVGYLTRLDEMAENIRAELDVGSPDPLDMLGELNRYLYSHLGFSGNLTDYFDPRNSFLNDVLDRRLGNPISLSLVHMEVGRRLGLPVEGVSFPGHFLVKMDVDGGAVIMDPFLQGTSLSLDELARRAESVFDADTPVRELLPQLLENASKKDILVRMLRNLKSIYQERQDYERLIHVVDMMLSVNPDLPRETRDRARVYQALDHHYAAIRDYRRYLQLAPQADDAEEVRELLVGLQALAPKLH